MNNYYQLAALYFQRFERADFFPKRNDFRIRLLCFSWQFFSVILFPVCKQHEIFPCLAAVCGALWL